MTSEGDARESLLRYLLGEMTAEEAATFDLRLLEDGEFADRVAEARFDLLDAYSAGELEQPLRREVELGLLPPAESPVSLALAQRLHNAKLLGVSQPLALRSRPWLAGWKRWRLPVAVAAAAVLAIAGGSYLVRKQRERSARQAEARRQGVSPKPHIGEPAFVLLLSPEVTRGAGGPRVAVLPRGARALEVQLVLEGQPAPGPYHVDVRSGKGQPVDSFSNLQAQRAGSIWFLQVTLPTHRVAQGNYQFDLSRQGFRGRPLRSYSVELVREAPPER